MYDRTHNLVSSSSLAKRSANINIPSRKRMSNKTVLEKMKTKPKIYKYHEEWAKKNGYREVDNDQLNVKNSERFINYEKEKEIDT